MKTRKKDVIEKIYRPLDGIDRTEVTEEAINKIKELENLKKSINQYFNNVHQEILPIQKTLFEILNYYYDLIDVDNLEYSIENVLNISKDELEEITNIIKEFDIEYNTLLENPHDKWTNVKLESITLDEKRNLSDNLNELINKLEIILNSLTVINEYIPEIELDIKEYYKYIEPIEIIYNTPTDYPNLFNKEKINEVSDLIDKQIKLNNIVLKNKEVIDSFFKENIYEYDLNELVLEFKNQINDLRNNITLYKLNTDNEILLNIKEYINYVKKYLENIEKIEEVKNKIFTTFALTNNDLINNNWKKIINLITNSLFDYKIHHNIKQYKNDLIKEVKEIIANLKSKKINMTDLVDVFGIEKAHELINIDQEEISKYWEVIHHTKGLGKLFKAEYIKTIKKLCNLFGIKNKKLVVKLLKAIYFYHAFDSKLDSNIENFNNITYKK